MDKKVEIKKTVFNKDEFYKVIKRNFTTFTQPEPVIDTDTVEELFRLYEALYFTMPVNGERNSHEYIVRRSLEVYNLERETEDIQPLLEEISSLRQQLLTANSTILKLETEAAGGGELDFENATLISSLESQLQAANATIASLQTQQISQDTVKEESAKAEAVSKKAEADAKLRQQINSVVQFISVDNSEIMTDIIQLSTRARNKRKKKRLDDKRDTDKMIDLLKRARSKFKDLELETIATGFNESPLKQRVEVFVGSGTGLGKRSLAKDKNKALRFKLIPLKSY
jgi:hypothetical protein